MTPNNALPLERTFFDIPSDREGAEAILEYLSNFPDAAKLDWPRLLQSDRILIVSEAGMGKTYECKQRQQILWSNSEPAFFIELSELGNDWVSDLSPGESGRFEAWQHGQLGTATFFLDSIDELLLTRKSFEQALKRFAKSIQGHLGRSKIVITTRPVPFDRQLIEQYLPNPAPIEVPKEAPLDAQSFFADIAMGVEKKAQKNEAENIELWRYVALAPLSQEQLKQIAVAQGIQDTERFLEEIRAHNAQEFVRRPLDAIELCADWRDCGRIRSHRDQVDHSVMVKLRSRRDRPDRTNLPPEQARTGAARLALGMLLTRKLTLCYATDAEARSGADGLDPRIILDDWSDDEVVTLLERPLFGFASYGRVRFHNRSIVEFLAAERLRALVDLGMPISTVKRLLFVNPNVGAPAVKPTMRPVAAWLALKNDSIRAEVMGREPNLLLSMGDPESLGTPERIAALERYVWKFGSGGWRGLRIPEIQIHRFASPVLSTTVTKLWQAGIENEEVRETLLKLIAAGKMTECADYAYAAAFDASRDEVERVYGLEALDALEDPRLTEALTLLASGSSGWPDELARAAILGLFPQRMSIPQLLSILNRLPDRPNQVAGVASLLPHLIDRQQWAPDDLRALLGGLMELIEPSVFWDSKYYRLAAKRADFVPTLITVCRILLQRGETYAALLNATVMALRVAQDGYRSEEALRAFRELFANLHPAAREKLFWADYQLMDRLHPTNDSWERFHRAAFDGVLPLNENADREWACAALTTSSHSLVEREVLLQCVMHWAQREPEQIACLNALFPLVSDQDSLQRLLDARIEGLQNPPPEPDWMVKHAQRSEEAKREFARHRESWVAFAREVAADPEGAFSESKCNNTLRNLWRAMIRFESAGMGTRAWNRPFMERVFGREVVDRLREALMKFWRNVHPTLVLERSVEQRNTTFEAWHLGLTAIAAEAENPRWAEALTPDEAELAARYAMIEANNFPAWLDALATVHPRSVEAIIGAQLAFELSDESNESSRHSMTLQNVGHATPKITQLLLPRVRSWLTAMLRGSDLTNTNFSHRLERAIELLVENGSTADVILAAAKRITTGTSNQYSVLLWVPVLVQLDPSSGVAALERLGDRATPTSQNLIIACIGNMFGEHTPRWKIDLKQPAFTPDLLLRLVLFIYEHVRPSDDRVHDGSYSPDTRDNAEHGRNRVLSALLEAEGMDAWHAKLKLASNPLIAHFKDRALAIAQEALAAEADRVILSEQEAVGLEHQYDFGPHTQADMAALLDDRLSDLHDLLLQDESPRAAWALIPDERILRRQIAGAFRSMARNAYTIDQESVTADENETDIRFRSATSTQQAVVELKIGDKDRSAAKLRSDLREQLVGKYLGPNDRRTGCFLISLASTRTWKHPEDNQSLSFEDLLNFLREYAKDIETEMGGAVSIRVEGLDLRAQTKH